MRWSSVVFLWSSACYPFLPGPYADYVDDSGVGDTEDTEEPDTDTDTDGDTDTDTDGDTDTDTDGDTDTDTDSDTVSSCPDDAMEPNDGTGTATALTSSRSGVKCPGDPDYFSVTGASGCGRTLTLDHDGDGDLALALLAGGVSWSAPGATTESMTYVAGATETLYAVVSSEPASIENDYTLATSLACSTAPSCPADDPLETVESDVTPVILGDGATYDGAVCDLDDWYTVYATAGCSVLVGVDFVDALGDLDAKLFRDGQQVDSATGVVDREELSAFATTAGAYQIRVYGYNGATNAYTVSVDACADTLSCPADDAHEPDDTAGTAYPLTPPATGQGISCSDADHVYVPSSDGCVVTASWTLPSFDAVTLYHGGFPAVVASGGLLVQSGITYEGETFGILGTSMPYTVVVEQACPSSTPTCSGDDLYEPNQSLQAAMPMSPFSTIDAVYCDDDDYYRVAVPAGCTGIFTLVHDHAAGDLDLYLMYEDTGGVAQESALPQDVETVQGAGPFDRYVLRVTSDAIASNAYTLTHDLHCSP